MNTKDLENLNLPTTDTTDDSTTDDKKDSSDKDKEKDKDKDKDKDDDDGLMYPIFLPGLGGLSLDEDESKE